MTDEWVQWHRAYERGTPMARRLEVVQGLLGRALDDAPRGPIRVVSMCAGDGRDLLGVLPAHPRRSDVRARLVELEPRLIDQGIKEARRLGLESVEFVRADAARSTSYRGAVPAQVVLACGIFGNIPDEEVRRTIEHLPELCARGAVVVWTRGRFAPDLTGSIRSWFREAGFRELAFVPIEGSTASVGADRFEGDPRDLRWEGPLFSFLPKPLRPSSRGASPDPATAPAAGRADSFRGEGTADRH